MTTPVCAACGASDLVPGVVAGPVQGAMVLPTWMPGYPEFGRLGGLKWRRKAMHHVLAHGCRQCGYLNLYVGARFNPPASDPPT